MYTTLRPFFMDKKTYKSVKKQFFSLKCFFCVFFFYICNSKFRLMMKFSLFMLLVLVTTISKAQSDIDALLAAGY